MRREVTSDQGWIQGDGRLERSPP